MKPENPNTSPNVEGEYINGETVSDRLPVLPAPEAVQSEGIERGAEHKEMAAEARAAATDVNNYSNSTQPVVTSTTQLDDTNDGTSDPITANNDDVIEKEWVDRAKKVISDTKDDPYKREEAVSKLQKDYLEKRYGKHLGASS